MENMLESCPGCLGHHLNAVCKIGEGQEQNYKEAWAETEAQPERERERDGLTGAYAKLRDGDRCTERQRDMRRDRN